MKYTNKSMLDYLSSNNQAILQSILDDNLISFFEKGLVKQGDGIFFKKIFSNSEAYFQTDNFDQYTDLSGFENTMNRFHVNDFSEGDSFNQVFAFLQSFKSIWIKEFPLLPCTIIIGFQDDEICRTATFTFHVSRKNEVIYDNTKIEEFINPIYIENFNQN